MDTNITCGLFTLLIILVIALHAYSAYNIGNTFISSLTKSTREGLLRGGLFGYFSGGATGAINNAATWGVLNGILAGAKEHLKI